jgi:hypothetical protein
MEHDPATEAADLDGYADGVDLHTRFLDEHPNSANYRTALASAMWQGGVRSIKKGYDPKTDPQGAFAYVQGFLRGLYEDTSDTVAI